MLEATKCAKGDDHDAATKGMNYNYLVARNSLIHIGAFSKKKSIPENGTKPI